MSHTVFLFFFNDTATTEIYTLSLHDALPISPRAICARRAAAASRTRSACLCASRMTSKVIEAERRVPRVELRRDRKSTRLNSSHANISYAVFCLKKKKIIIQLTADHRHPILQ